jgi:hypothetical protein
VAHFGYGAVVADVSDVTVGPVAVGWIIDPPPEG